MIRETNENIKRHESLKALKPAELLRYCQVNNPMNYDAIQLAKLTDIIRQAVKRPLPTDIMNKLYIDGVEQHYTYKINSGFGFYAFKDTDFRYLMS